MLSLLGTAKIVGGVGARKTSFHVSHPTTDFEQPTDVHIADNLIWVVRCCSKLFEVYEVKMVVKMEVNSLRSWELKRTLHC